MVLMIIDGVLNPNHQTLGKIGNNGLYSICLNYTSMLPNVTIHPASRGVAAHTAGLFRSVRGAKGGFPPWGLPKLRIFTFPPRGGSPS